MSKDTQNCLLKHGILKPPLSLSFKRFAVSDQHYAGIDFTLPRQSKLAAARDIGDRCGSAWAEVTREALPSRAQWPSAIATWTGQTLAAWHQGFEEGWERAKNAPPAATGHGALIGYARVSTQDQTTDLQLDALSKAGCARVFSESASGAQRDRPELARALDHMRHGDTLVVWKLDRLARSLKQLVDTVETLEGRGVGFRSLTEAIDTTTAGGKLVFHIFAALAEFERGMIKERTLAGLDAARARGRFGGRPRSLKEQDLQAARAMLANPLITVEEVADRLGVAPATLYRYLPGGRGALGL